MPREIDCDCVDGYKVGPNGTTWCNKCNLLNLGKTPGKIILYTQTEFDKAVKAEREACALECDKRRDRYIYSDPYDSDSEQEAIELCAEAIRARNK